MRGRPYFVVRDGKLLERHRDIFGDLYRDPKHWKGLVLHSEQAQMKFSGSKEELRWRLSYDPVVVELKEVAPRAAARGSLRRWALERRIDQEDEGDEDQVDRGSAGRFDRLG